ncbi:MAG: acyl-CoA dehydrogenase family protein [Sneathiellaceae bacterium]
MLKDLLQDPSPVLAVAERFAAEEMAPAAAAWERERRYPRDAFAAAAEAGLCRLFVPKADGGHGLSCLERIALWEILARVDFGFTFSLVVHTAFAAAIHRNGSPAQRERFAAPMLAGDSLGAFLLTEPQGGSDAAGITTRAVRDGEGWRISGAKSWVTNAASADLLHLYAQTDPDAGWRGIAAFLVDANGPGVVREAPYFMLGGHSMGVGGFRFEEAPVAADRMLFAPGEGFKAALGGITIARIVVPAMCAGMLQAALDLAGAALTGRRAFGQDLAAFQGLQWRLADVATDLHAIRCMAADAARRVDAGEDAQIAAAHVKKFAPARALEGLAACMQLMGADGLKQDHPLPRHLAAAKLAQYMDGSSEIQNRVLARHLLGRG